MQCIKEFTNTSLVQVAQETLETRAHTVCMRKIPYTCLHPRLSASWMPASPPDGSRPPHTHTHCSCSASLSLALVKTLCWYTSGDLWSLSLLQLGHIFIASVVGVERGTAMITLEITSVSDRWDQHYWLHVLITMSTTYKNDYNNKF